MKSFILFTTLLLLGMTKTYCQDLSVPDSILSELNTVRLINHDDQKDTLTFKIVFPKDYNATKNYPVLLCLSGGSQSEAIVDYCYAAWFKSAYFKNYLSILPVSKKGKNLRNASNKDILAIVNTIKNNYKTSNSNWIVAGTSNGGVASFEFAAVSPKLYGGIIVAPGVLDSNIVLNDDWKHLKIVLAYGEKDTEGWIENSLKTKKRMRPFVRRVSSIVLEGQGHILPIDFDIDKVYRAYFNKKK